MTSSAPMAGYVAPPWRTYLRRGTLPVLLGMVLGVLLAAGLLQVVAKQWTAQAKVNVVDTGLDTITTATNARTTGSINLDTEAQLVTSAGVLHLASDSDPELLKRYTFNKLVTHIAVTVPANTTVLQIAYTDSSPQLAQAGANALSSAYLSNRQQTAQSQLTQQINQTQSAENTLTNQLQSLIKQAAALPSGSTQKSVVNTQISFVKGRIRGLDQTLVALEGVHITPGFIVNQANFPQRPSSPSKTIYLASGLAIGLLLGLLAAWLRIRFRRRVRNADDLGHVVDVPCIAVLHRADPTVVGALAAYRHLTVVVSTVVQPPARVVVTSPLVASECSHVAAGLAAALTRRGMASAVLQVHGDEVSAPELPAVPAVRVLDADDVLTAEDASLPAALDRLRAGRPMLVVDVPGAVITTDAQVMGAEADAVLVVVTAGTRTARVRQTIAGLDSVGAPILGTVLVQRAEPAAAPTGTPRSSAASAPPEDGLDTLGWPADEPNGRSAAPTARSTNSKRSRRTAVSSRGNR